MYYAKITITVGQRSTGGLAPLTRPYAEAEVEAKGMNTEQLGKLTESARATASYLAETLGIEPRTVVTHEAELKREGDAALERQMHEAIDAALPTLRTIVGDLRGNRMETTANALEGVTSELAASRSLAE